MNSASQLATTLCQCALALQDQVNGGRCDVPAASSLAFAIRHGVVLSNKLSAAWIAVVVDPANIQCGVDTARMA